jgi:hypothetical protein
MALDWHWEEQGKASMHKLATLYPVKQFCASQISQEPQNYNELTCNFMLTNAMHRSAAAGRPVLLHPLTMSWRKTRTPSGVTRVL